jgi:CheY-like chemotaxis protein
MRPERSATTTPPRAGSARVLAMSRRHVPHDDSEGGGFDVGKNTLKGVNVLIVEDDFIVAYDIQTLMEEQGATIVGPAASLDEARSVIAASATPIHVAVLDVNLSGAFVFPIAAQLRRAGVPFVFATAYADDDRLFPPDLKDAPRLAKPVMPNVLIGQLRRLLG